MTPQWQELLSFSSQKRPELRLVIASATLDADELRDYFDLRKRGKKLATCEPKTEHGDYQPGSATIMSIEGRHFPVEIFYVQGELAQVFLYLSFPIRNRNKRGWKR